MSYIVNVVVFVDDTLLTLSLFNYFRRICILTFKGFALKSALWRSNFAIFASILVQAFISMDQTPNDTGLSSIICTGP